MTRRILIVLATVYTIFTTLALLVQDTRIIAVAVWGFGTILVWGAVWWKAIRQWRVYRDRRAQGDVRSDGALFIVALAAGASIATALFSPDGENALRYTARVLSALALGLFFGAGVVKLTEAPPDPPEDQDVEGHRSTVARGR